MDMVAVYRPRSESEARTIESMMRAYDIRYFMQGGEFSTMYPGRISNSLNAQILMVAAEHVELARALLEPFTGPEDPS